MITQVKQILGPVNLDGAVVTGDAAHAQRDTAEYLAGSKDDGNRGSDYLLFAKGNQPGLQHAICNAIQAHPPASRTTLSWTTARPDHQALHLGHRRQPQASS